MKSLRYWWREPRIAWLIQTYQALSGREQLLTRMTMNLLVAALVLWLLAQPLWNRIQQQWLEQQQAEQTNQQLQQQLVQLQQQHLQDPNRALRDELAQLTAQQALLDGRINALTSALVSPAQMTSLLSNMLAQDKGLKPTSLITLAPQRVELGEGFDDVELYRHRLRITMQASYQGLVKYLSQLDQVPWLISWDTLSYDTRRYPQGDLLLEVSTLSRKQEVLGGR